MKKQAKIHFNKEAVKKMSKAQFLENHDHHKDEIDLNKAYDEIVGDEPEKAKEPKKASK